MTHLVPIFAALLASSVLAASLPLPALGASVNRNDCSKPYWTSLSLIHISEPTRPAPLSRMPSSA